MTATMLTACRGRMTTLQPLSLSLLQQPTAAGVVTAVETIEPTSDANKGRTRRRTLCTSSTTITHFSIPTSSSSSSLSLSRSLSPLHLQLLALPRLFNTASSSSRATTISTLSSPFINMNNHVQQPTKRSFHSTTSVMKPGAVGATVKKAAAPRTPRKAALTLTPAAVQRLKQLLADPDSPKMLKVGTRKKGCSGQTYNLEYVTEKGKFDEVIEQDGVKVLVDSKALFSLIGSEMDYVEDTLASQFVFHNPNIKEMCGCGQSFMV
ncbi:Iron-sulfur assembly protein 1 [Blyttiomyces sp. JEL0837]|nr:Iron-sulfur assembly protein 1 [Blyttiomyces sp. JEL0837]